MWLKDFISMKACLRKAKADDKVGGKDADWMPPRYSLETGMWQKNCFVKTWSCKWSFLPCHQPISICPNGWTWVKRQETSLLSYHHHFSFVLWCLFTSIPSTELAHLSNTCFYNNKQKRKNNCIPRPLVASVRYHDGGNDHHRHHVLPSRQLLDWAHLDVVHSTFSPKTCRWCIK